MVFERCVPWMVCAEGRDIVEFYFTVPNRPGQLRKALDVFARHGINILSVSAYALPEWERGVVFVFADFTGLGVNAEDVRRELEAVTGSDVHVKEPPVRGFMMDEFAFPLYAFPGARSLIMLEKDFQEMVRGFYEKIEEAAAVLLYHLAYSGGRFLAEYLSEKLGLRGRELLVEVLKVYQATGWGRVELVEYDPHAAKIVLRLYDSIECKALEGLGRPASQFIRGHLSGLLSGLLKTDVRAVETKCVAKGDPYCEFYVEEV
ncbi:MAG: hypothetical protein DRJ56_03425 [Thermoprotei archaeon]|nr:MAG: hypothetical protein DRJ56_03425 [Thermoprotei archaeon]